VLVSVAPVQAPILSSPPVPPRADIAAAQPSLPPPSHPVIARTAARPVPVPSDSAALETQKIIARSYGNTAGEPVRKMALQPAWIPPRTALPPSGSLSPKALATVAAASDPGISAAQRIRAASPPPAAEMQPLPPQAQARVVSVDIPAASAPSPAAVSAPPVQADPDAIPEGIKIRVLPAAAVNVVAVPVPTPEPPVQAPAVARANIVDVPAPQTASLPPALPPAEPAPEVKQPFLDRILSHIRSKPPEPAPAPVAQQYAAAPALAVPDRQYPDSRSMAVISQIRSTASAREIPSVSRDPAPAVPVYIPVVAPTPAAPPPVVQASAPPPESPPVQEALPAPEEVLPQAETPAQVQQASVQPTPEERRAQQQEWLKTCPKRAWLSVAKSDARKPAWIKGGPDSLGRCRVSYRGYTAASDEWVTSDRMDVLAAQ
nr:hypothetical protein [Pseudomonadota bacterium]